MSRAPCGPPQMEPMDYKRLKLKTDVNSTCACLQSFKLSRGKLTANHRSPSICGSNAGCIPNFEKG